MVQIVKTIEIPAGGDVVAFESVNILKRCFFGIYAIDLTTSVLDFILISFGDSSFTSVFTLSPYKLFLESSGKNVYQGSILVKNNSLATTYRLTTTEILE